MPRTEKETAFNSARFELEISEKKWNETSQEARIALIQQNAQRIIATLSAEDIEKFNNVIRSRDLLLENISFEIIDPKLNYCPPKLQISVSQDYVVSADYEEILKEKIETQFDAIRKIAITGEGSEKTLLAAHYLVAYQNKNPTHNVFIISAESSEIFWDTQKNLLINLLNYPLLAEKIEDCGDLLYRKKTLIREAMKQILYSIPWCILINSWNKSEVSMGEIESLFFVGRGTFLITATTGRPFAAENQYLKLNEELICRNVSESIPLPENTVFSDDKNRGISPTRTKSSVFRADTKIVIQLEEKKTLNENSKDSSCSI